MRFSRSLKSSPHSLPSPDGAYIATVLPSKLTLRSTRSLELSRVISLPPELSSSIQWFLWSPSSERVLVCASDCISVYSTTDQQFAAKITNPTAGTAKITSITFGATHNEVSVFSDFGLKLTVFHLTTSTSIEIPAPKFYSSNNSSKGYAYRPRTSSLALLTRTRGKDVISIHTRQTYEVIRSWYADTVDAQGISWSPEGRWLAVIESAGQGHKVLFYTADGHLFKVWNGPTPTSDEDKDLAMGGGVKMLEWAPTGEYLAIGDYNARATLLTAPTFHVQIKPISRNNHQAGFRTSGKPPCFACDNCAWLITSLKIWQEHVTPSQSGGFDRAFALCVNTVCPPTTGSSPATSDQNTKTGTNILTFDNSGTLIASRSESMPTTIWIWDIASKILKAVMVLHAPIAKATWHPIINELLLIRCEGDESKGFAYLWEPTWGGPKILNFKTQVPEGKIIGRSVARWLNVDPSTPAIFFSDSQDCILASLSESEEDGLPWQDAAVRGVDIYGQREESPLNLVAADDKFKLGKGSFGGFMNAEPTMTGMTGGSDEVDDTFRFKRFADP